MVSELQILWQQGVQQPWQLMARLGLGTKGLRLGCQLRLDSRPTIELTLLPGCPGHILATQGRSTLPPTAHQ